MLAWLLCWLLLAGLAPAASETGRASVKVQQTDKATAAEYDRLVDQFFDAYFTLSPSAATSAGLHQYDSLLEDYSRGGVERAIATAKEYQARFEKLDASGLTPEQQADRELVLAHIDGELLELEEIRGWEKNPDEYSSGIAESAFTIMSRKFAPPQQRLGALVARERQMPKVFEEARHNLKNPPRIYTEVALDQLPGIIAFFQNDVPAAFTEVTDAELAAGFKQANDAVIAALEGYEKFLREELLPASHGDFRIGAANYRKKLAYDEMVDIPLDRLLQAGYADLHRNQEEFKRVASLLDSSKTAAQAAAELQDDYPAPAELIPAFRQLLGSLRDYIAAQRIVAIPPSGPPVLEETPAFMRALTFASMDTPGPYEQIAKEAFFNVTLPEASWPAQRVKEFMGGFNRSIMVSVAVHEVYPGHYVQFLWLQHVPSKVRKLLGCSSNAEGWAHYTEQMMLDQGYGRDPKVPEEKDGNFLKLRLGQLQDALLRDARFIAGISMHTGSMTFDQAIDFFVKEGYQPREVAERETRRGTSDPTYLVYTLGKLQILKLRDDYKRKMGSKFSLEEFHNTFLQQGYPPVKLIREAMLGDDSPAL
jgi:uncharacterized protein (DUF885 family)